MKRITKLIIISLAFLLVLVSGCTNASKAKSSVDLMFGVYKRGDAQAVENLIKDFAGEITIPAVPDAISSLLSGIIPSTEMTFQLSGRIIAAMIQKTMDNIQWKNVSTKSVSDREIIVTTEVSNLDMKDLIGKYAVKIAGFTLTSLFSGYSEAERIQKCKDLLTETVQENKNSRMTWTLNILVKQVNGQWQVVMSDDIINAMTGGLLSAYSNVTYILSKLSEFIK